MCRINLLPGVENLFTLSVDRSDRMPIEANRPRLPVLEITAGGRGHDRHRGVIIFTDRKYLQLS